MNKEKEMKITSSLTRYNDKQKQKIKLIFRKVYNEFEFGQIMSYWLNMEGNIKIVSKLLIFDDTLDYFIKIKIFMTNTK